MSLTALTHRKLTPVSAASATASAVLDAIWACVDPAVTTYVNGAARSFSGTGATGWTWTRVQVGGVTEAVYGTPPGGTMNQRVIIASRSATPTPSPLMVAPETFQASNLLIAHAKGAGAFTTWNAANPFTTGDFSGYTRVGGLITGMALPVQVSVIETQEDITLQLYIGGATLLYAGGGAFIDPESTAAGTGETDGRRYGFWTCGTAAVTNMLGNASTGSVFIHSTTGASNTHTYVWRPGTSTIETVSRTWVLAAGITPAMMVNAAGEFGSVPFFLHGSISGLLGRVREKVITRSALANQTITNPSGTTLLGYAIAPSPTTVGDTLLAKY